MDIETNQSSNRKHELPNPLQEVLGAFSKASAQSHFPGSFTGQKIEGAAIKRSSWVSGFSSDQQETVDHMEVMGPLGERDHVNLERFFKKEGNAMHGP